MMLSPTDLADLRAAKSLLEHVSLSVRIANAIGAPVERLFGLLPKGASDLVMGVSAALAGILTIAFFTIGQAVQVLVADADSRTVLVAALASYIGRVVGLGALLALALANADRLRAMDPVAVAVSTIVVVLGWRLARWLVATPRIPFGG